MVHFSGRVPRDLRPNRLTTVRAGCGEIPFDLTVTNPTRCDLPYDPALLADLAAPAALTYEPHPRGPWAARRAVAGLYADLAPAVEPEHILLSASTSEAYSFLFRLLADPGDTILVPAPSYPLFGQLTRLDAVETLDYPLDEDGGWRIDLSALAAAPPSTRAVIVVHPNNPTGSFVDPGDAVLLRRHCRERGWALIADEVFLPFVHDVAPAPASFATTSECLCFTLGGLSKSVGLPQLKLAWTVVGGPSPLVAEALERLDHIADAALSVSTPVALAAPRLLTAGATVQEAIRHRCRCNLRSLGQAVAEVPAVTLHRPAGGWSAVLRVPTVVDEEELLVRALVEEGVAAHPGYFFDFPRPGYLVLSLLPPEEIFAEGVRRLLATVADSL
jgi:aspartate/methionine/tyrosine aminotransferase